MASLDIFRKRAVSTSSDASNSAPGQRAASVERGPKFEITIDPAFFGLENNNPLVTASRISRTAAMQVPAVKRGRDLIAGSLGSLPVDLIGPDKQPANWRMFDQPEIGTPRSVTMTRTIEDLLFEGVAWWHITEFSWNTFPTRVVRLDPRSVSVSKEGKVYVTRQGNYGQTVEWLNDADLIRFDSPNDPLLVAGARAIRTALQLDAASARFAEGLPPLDYFTPAEGADPADDTDVTDLLTDWQTARQTRSTAYIPAALEYHANTGFSPEQLQLADARQHAVLEIARVMGIDPEELGVSTTSRTYSNQFDRRKAFVDFTLGGYRQAIEDRLSMTDVTPRGYYAKFNLSTFLRSDDKTRFETYALGLQVGAITSDEIRELEDRPPLTADERAAIAPAPALPAPAGDNANV